MREEGVNRGKPLFVFVLMAMLLSMLGAVSIGRADVMAEDRLPPGTAAPIRLQAATFVPALGEEPDIPASLRISEVAWGESGYYIVQFQGPILPRWKNDVEALGGVLLDYIPDFAFVVQMNQAAAESVAQLEEVVWVGLYQPAYKLSSDLNGVEGMVDVVVLTFPTGSTENVTSQARSLGASVHDVSANAFGGLLRMTTDASELAALAHVPDVYWIEPFYERVLFNDVARSSALMDAESAWADLGLYGQGQTVAVADTGLDTGSLATLHADFRGTPTGCSGSDRIVATYALGRPGDWSDSCRYRDGAVWVNDGGHGTHVAGSVLGNGCNSGSSGTPDYSGSHAGLAPQANLVFQSVMDSACGLLGIPDDLNDLFSQAAGAGATIHTNSWGADVAGLYTTDSRNTDVYMWEHKDFTILFAAANAGTDSNNDGRVDLDSMASPATAKNCITVGATENDRAYGGVNPEHIGDPFDEVQCVTGPAWGDCWPSDYPANPINDDLISDDPEGMAAFSSRGPTNDGRIKPDVVAPGTNILSTKSQGAYVSGGWGPGDNQYYQFMGGTSMAAPLTAGGTALVRQFYTDIEGITPSSALIKATLINSAVDVYPGQYANPVEQWPDRLPNNVQGWGRVNVGNATDGSHYYADPGDGSGLGTGENHTYNYTVCATGVFKVTLVWTDYPGSTATGGALVNDLDLVVTAPDGTTTYRGNVFSGGWSTTGGSADRTNNVESVYINAPSSGEWTVRVSGYNVPQGTRPGYALVVDMPDNDCANDFTIDVTPVEQTICVGEDASYNVAVGSLLGFNDPVTLSASGNPGAASFSPNPVTPPADGSANSTLTIDGASVGSTTFDVVGTAGNLVHQDEVTLIVADASATVTALSPADGAVDQSTTPTLSWSDSSSAGDYDVEIATDPDFGSVVDSATGLSNPSYAVSSALDLDTVYYWQVTVHGPCGDTVSDGFSFRTASSSVCEEVLLDGGFENGPPPDSDWFESSTQGWELIDATYPRTGTYSAWLGGDDDENGQIWQTVAIDSSATSVTLTYWYWLSSDDICDYDYGYVKINGTTRTTYDLCTATNTGGYVEATLDLTGESGPTELRFQATTDWDILGSPSSFLVDDVSIEECISGGQETADYSDLAASYGVAWHTGDGALRLGSLWTADDSYAPGSDDGSDDGVVFGDFRPGETETVQVTVQGTAANGRWLRAWFDWDHNGTFDTGELVYDGSVSDGANDISVAVPAGLALQTVPYRFRLYDSSNAPRAQDADSYGGVDGGEVEDGYSPIPAEAFVYLPLVMKE
jgi:subtilisin family serine protease